MIKKFTSKGYLYHRLENLLITIDYQLRNLQIALKGGMHGREIRLCSGRYAARFVNWRGIRRYLQPRFDKTNYRTDLSFSRIEGILIKKEVPGYPGTSLFFSGIEK
jgi:hypothetical protein